MPLILSIVFPCVARVKLCILFTDQTVSKYSLPIVLCSPARLIRMNCGIILQHQLVQPPSTLLRPLIKVLSRSSTYLNNSVISPFLSFQISCLILLIVPCVLKHRWQQHCYRIPSRHLSQYISYTCHSISTTPVIVYLLSPTPVIVYLLTCYSFFFVAMWQDEQVKR